jgi:hypothetical protein
MIRKFAALSLVAALAACSDSTGPEDYDPVAANSLAETVLGALDGNDALVSLSVLGPAMQLSAAGPVLSVMPFDPTGGSAATAARLRDLRDVLPSFGSTGALALFPVDLLGATFVYNPDLGEYQIDPEATGAPADGVRFILYAVDPILHSVVLPLNQVGYLDLIDVSTASADAVRIVAVVGDVTYIDYVASASVGTSSATISAEGFLFDGTDQVDFDMSITLTTSQFSVDYLLSTDDGSIRLQAALSSEDESMTAELTLEGDGDTIVLEFTVGTSTVSGEIRYNGDVVVTVAGTPEAPTFTKPDGTALTQDEIDALEAFGEIVDYLFDAFDNLLWPAILVFAIGN